MQTVFTKNTNGGEATWLPFSDLMSVLMLIFLLIAVISIFENNKKTRVVEEVSDSYLEVRKNIYNDLQTAFKDSLDSWKATIDPNSLNIQFQDEKILFAQGQDQLKPRFRKILDYFFPIYVKTVLKYQEHIDEIKIEGHTSREWDNRITKLGYFENMRLSQDRTRTVLQYALGIRESTITKNYYWLQEHLTANGYSSSRFIKDGNGKEDKRKSRRVEFTIKTNSEKVLGKIQDMVSGISS